MNKETTSLDEFSVQNNNKIHAKNKIKKDVAHFKKQILLLKGTVELHNQLYSKIGGDAFATGLVFGMAAEKIFTGSIFQNPLYYSGFGLVVCYQLRNMYNAWGFTSHIKEMDEAINSFAKKIDLELPHQQKEKTSITKS